MDTFEMNGRTWQVVFVDSSDRRLIDRTGLLTLATTDPSRGTIYISNNLYGSMLARVLIHELGHVTMISFGLISDIHRMVRPAYWIEAEEWVCNFIADYGYTIFKIAESVLGANAWAYIPNELERLIS